jgi:DNA-binding winged helix-turn-helix (wHTH) protein
MSKVKVKLAPQTMKILRILSDGEEHAIAELHACLWDAEQGPQNNVMAHITRIRKALVGQRWTILQVGKQHDLRYQVVQFKPAAMRIEIANPV